MNDPRLLRKHLRAVLRAKASNDGMTEGMIRDGLGYLVAERPTVPELKEALAWNHERGNIDFHPASKTESEETEWYLTEKGKSA